MRLPNCAQPYKGALMQVFMSALHCKQSRELTSSLSQDSALSTQAEQARQPLASSLIFGPQRIKRSQSSQFLFKEFVEMSVYIFGHMRSALGGVSTRQRVATPVQMSLPAYSGLHCGTSLPRCMTAGQLHFKAAAELLSAGLGAFFATSKRGRAVL